MRFENDPQLKLIRSVICLLLALLVVVGMALPGVTMERQEPEDPLADTPVQEVTLLQVGEELLQDSPIRIPSQERSPEAETLPPETEETQPEDQQQDIPVTQPAGESEEEGAEDGTQGELGGETADLDLAMVLTWYPAGNKEESIVCQSMASRTKTINTAKLSGTVFRYRFAPTGDDAPRIRNYTLSYQEGNSTFRTLETEGELTVSVPEEGETREDTFQINATYRPADSKAEQKLTFTFIIRWENKPDLELTFRWKRGEDWQEVSCSSGARKAFTVNCEDLEERRLSYEATLTGALKEDYELVRCQVTTDEDATPTNWTPESGIVTLRAADSRNSQTYYLTFTAKSSTGELTFSYQLTYQESPDVKLQFRWQGKNGAGNTELLRDGDTRTVEIRNDQLSAGAIAYEMELTGQNKGAGVIQLISYSAEPRKEQGEKGSLPMALSSGETEQTFTLEVSARVWNQTLHYTLQFHVTSDVMLQMNYTVDGQACIATCENGKIETTEEVYDDQLSGGQLSYTMELLGADSSNLTITGVELFQMKNGNGSSVRIKDSGTVELQLNGGKKGTNEFTVTAEGNGQSYHFTIQIPYKHRGGNNVIIETNLQDGQTVINETETNLTVKAYYWDETGNRITIPPEGTDTKLIVTLDGEEVPHVGLEYALYPKNPEVGDRNTHTLIIYAENAYGDYGEKTIELIGQRQQKGQVTGTAAIYVDMTVLGLGVYGPLSYEVLADEPVSYTVVKAIMGQDTGDPFGAAGESFGWSGKSEGKLDDGFYLQSLNTGLTPDTLTDTMWPGSSEAEVLAAIDDRFGARSNLATLWRCIYRNGLNKSGGSGGTFGENDYTNGSGWLYSIGGETYYPGQSMSELYLKNGDILTLRYTLAYGWDVGGGTEGYGNTAGYCVTALNGNWYVNHVMEETVDADGVTCQICHCCGLVEDCSHINRFWQDQQDGTHVEYCPDCQSLLGSPDYHSWEDSVSNEENHYCPVCGCEEPHIWRELEGTTATCTEAGVSRFVCDICGTQREEEVPPLGHTLDNRWNYDLQVHYQVCSTCQEEFNRGSHNYVYSSDWDDFLCSDCNILHQWDAGCDGEWNILSATCQQIRYLCSGCGYELAKEGVFDDYHSYGSDGCCFYCGQRDPELHEHHYVLTEEVAADCENDGYLLYSCECGEYYTETIPATDHDWSDWETSDEETGEQWRYCFNCWKEEYYIPTPPESQSLLRQILWRIR